MPNALIHRRQLVVADDIAALYVLLVLGALVGDMVDEDDAVARLGIEDDVLLGLAPGFKLGPVDWVEVGRLHLMPIFDELQMGQVGAVVLKVEGGVDADRLHRQAGVAEVAQLLPVAVEIEMPFLEIGARVDVRAEAAQLALPPHHSFQDWADAGMADEGRIGIRFTVQERIEPHIAYVVQPLFPAHRARMVDALADMLGFCRCERILDSNEAVFFELIQFGFHIVHASPPCRNRTVCHILLVLISESKVSELCKGSILNRNQA